MEYDHEGQKTSKGNLENENPIICHSFEEGKGNKKTKLFFLFLCRYDTESKPKRVPKYEAESKNEVESKEKVSSSTPE